MTSKNNLEIKIVPGDYLKNVFEHWVSKIEKDIVVYIASIPFARNIIEYIRGKEDNDYKKLTELLHMKQDTKTITTTDLDNIYKGIWSNKVFNSKNKCIYDIILEQTTIIANDVTESIKLENKIILSIGIRLLAEGYMISEINNPKLILEIGSNQTRGLLNLYKKMFKNNIPEITLMEQVSMMTAENIHINAFMYEPILDLSDSYLKKIYKEIMACINKNI